MPIAPARYGYRPLRPVRYEDGTLQALRAEFLERRRRAVNFEARWRDPAAGASNDSATRPFGSIPSSRPDVQSIQRRALEGAAPPPSSSRTVGLAAEPAATHAPVEAPFALAGCRNPELPCGRNSELRSDPYSIDGSEPCSQNPSLCGPTCSSRQDDAACGYLLLRNRRFKADAKPPHDPVARDTDLSTLAASRLGA